MRIIFMGTPIFASVSLSRLYHEKHDVVAVFSQPDKPRGRGMKISETPVKLTAIEQNTPIFQPATLKDGFAYSTIKEFHCDLIVTVAFGKFLPKEILDLPSMGCINIHASLLPKYRGAAPIQHAVIDGETETGVTSIFLSEEMDAGDMILSKKILICKDETSGELYNRLADLGAELLSETVSSIQNGCFVRVPQDHNNATYAPPIDKQMAIIDWNATAFEIKNKVRGLNPIPGARAEINGSLYKIHSVDISGNKSEKKCGEIISTSGGILEVACQDGSVLIHEIQAPGAKKMSAADFLRGHKL